MTMLLSTMMAVAVSLHGVIGQSAAGNETPLAFTGVRSLVGLPGERIVFIGDDGLLYEIRGGRPVSTGKTAKGSRLDFDGRVLRSLGIYQGVWEVDTSTFESRQAIAARGVRWDLAGIRPESSGHPFADRCKFVTWDPKADRMVAYAADGSEVGELFPLPERKQNCRIEGFGFLPETGDLLMVTYWPDLQIYRFRHDGSQVVGDGWPVRRGFGSLRTSCGRIWHCGTSSILPLAPNMTGLKPLTLTVGQESELNGYAVQGELEFVGTSQGLYARRRGEREFRRRFGGIGRLTAMAVNDGLVFLSMGDKIRWLYLDGDENEPFASSDDQLMRIDNGGNWKDRILDLAPDGKGWLKVAAGCAGSWRFRPDPPVEYVNHRKLWIRISDKPCEKVSARKPSAKLLKILAETRVPGGLKVGKVAAQGHWLVVEDVLNHRLLRFRIGKEKENDE